MIYPTDISHKNFFKNGCEKKTKLQYYSMYWVNSYFAHNESIIEV